MRLRRFILSGSCWILFGAVAPDAAAGGQCHRDTFLTLAGSSDPSQNVPRVGGAAPEETLLTQKQVLDLPVAAIVTATEWTPKSRFEGPLLKDVVALVATRGTRLEVQALNNYSASIPWEDIVQFNPILAYSQNGRRMNRDRFGPLFIVYPRDRYPALRAPTYLARMVWQVCRIDVR